MNFKYVTYIVLFTSFFLNQLDAGCGSCTAHRKKPKKLLPKLFHQMLKWLKYHFQQSCVECVRQILKMLLVLQMEFSK